MRPILVIFILWTGCIRGSCQNTIGIPDIVNYPKEVYGAGTQNRGIVQDKNGVLYFANYEGLLSFDGTYWKSYPLPNRSVVRAIAIGADNKIYAGGQDDFGYFSPDSSGRLTYTSLKSLLSEKNYSFTDIWNVVPYGNDVFFRCREKIFQLNNQSITVYPAASEWQFLGVSNHRLIAQDGKNGLLEFGGGLWKPLAGQGGTAGPEEPGADGSGHVRTLPPGFLVTDIFPFGADSAFLTTVNTGFFILAGDKITPFHFAGPNPFLNQRILTAIPVNKDWIAVGTNLDGAYIINRKGAIIQNLSRKEGLQNNNILKLFLDNNNNLWLGLDNGIDFVAYNNAIKHIYPEKLNEGLGYTSIIFDKDLYVGTSNGLYRVPVGDKEDLSYINAEFQPVAGTRGSTLGLSEVNGSLLLGHHDGAFLIRDGRLIPIDKRTTYWTFLPFSNVLPSSLVIAGNDKGLDIFEYRQNAFLSRGNIPDFNASSQFMAIDNNNIIWVAHPYRGIYKVDINDPAHPLIKLYREQSGLPSFLKNHLFKVKNHIVVTTQKGIYEYNADKDAFVASTYFSTLLGQRNIRFLKEDAAGNIWFIEENSLGVVDFSGSRPEVIYFPEMSGKMVTDFEHIYPYDKSNVFVGAEKGFYHINYEEYKKNRLPIQVRIRQVKAFGKTDSLLFGGYFGEAGENAEQPAGVVYRIANGYNSLHFEYSTPLYAAQNSVQYSYTLTGYDKDWSAWSKRTEKEYTNLPPGVYTFQVRSKSNLGNESVISHYSFKVLPPWYLSSFAYCMYVLLFFVLVYLLYRWQRRLLLRQQKKYEEEQKRLQYLHQLEIEKSEKEIVKLKNEKLESEIEHKNTELASAAMHLVQKGELLGNIREELMRLKKGGNGDGAADEFKKMLRILGEENKMDKDWEQFAVHFDKVHSDFLRTVKTVYPGLSAHELKLCAYLRMNLSSKEIAQLENISVRGVEISRYRLRKKLKISTETNLFEFLLQLH